MRFWRIKATKSALSQFYDLPVDVRSRIRECLRCYANKENPMRDATHLSGIAPGMYELRVGKYRIVFFPAKNGGIKKFKVYKGKMVVVAVGLRKEIARLVKEAYDHGNFDM